MKSKQVLIALVLVSGSALAQLGPIPGAQKVNPAFDGADLVCNCFVKDLRVLGQQELERDGKSFIRRQVLASVVVSDFYKGNAQIGPDIKIPFEEEIPVTRSMPTLSAGETGLMFLKITSGSVYDFADPFLAITPFASIPVQHGTTGVQKLEFALADVVQHGNRDDQINAMRLLEGLDRLHSETVKRILPSSNSDDPAVALSCLAVLLKAKVRESPYILEKYLRGHRLNSMPAAVLSIGSELSQLDDSEDLQPLGWLSTSEILSIKFGAIAGLRKMRSPLSAKFLVDRLDDANPDVRFEAVVTLAEIFSKGGDFAPTELAFDQNPDFYTNEWKAWWIGEGRSMYR